MATTTIPVFNSTINADTNANANTVAQRDSQGNLYANVMSGATLQSSGNFQGNAVTKTTSFTAGAATDYLVDCTSGAVTVTLPAASANAGVTYWFTKKDSSANTVTLSGVLGTSTISSQYAHVRVVSDGTSWFGAA